MSKIELIATATFGLEAVVAHEVKKLGYEEAIVENGRVTFTADEAAICRCNLWLRSADRVLVKMGSFQAVTFEELFQQTRALPWSDWLPANAHFPVRGKSVKSKLFSVSDCQAIVKKAVVEKMKQKYGREWFDEDGPSFPIEVSLLKDESVKPKRWKSCTARWAAYFLSSIPGHIISLPPIRALNNCLGRTPINAGSFITVGLSVSITNMPDPGRQEGWRMRMYNYSSGKR